MGLPPGTRALLLDVEGTTTPVSFVYDVLFPFARDRLEVACARADSEPELAEAVGVLRREHDEMKGEETGVPAEFGNGSGFARYLMDRDRKSTGLKLLQGLIWKGGYRDGTLKGQVFPDVPAALAELGRRGVRIRIFSSGSVLAQKLLFSNTEYGDLTKHVEAHHDTTTGPKKEPDSYRRIAGSFGLPARGILFLSDVVDELNAAREAEMQTGLCVRPGNAPTTDDAHPVYRSLGELV